MVRLHIIVSRAAKFIQIREWLLHVSVSKAEIWTYVSVWTSDEPMNEHCCWPAALPCWMKTELARFLGAYIWHLIFEVNDFSLRQSLTSNDGRHSGAIWIPGCVHAGFNLSSCVLAPLSVCSVLLLLVFHFVRWTLPLLFCIYTMLLIGASGGWWCKRF